MKLSPSQMKTVRHQFDSLCRKVLGEESRNYKKQFARRAEKEVNLSKLSETELSLLYVMDECRIFLTFPVFINSSIWDAVQFRVP